MAKLNATDKKMREMAADAPNFGALDYNDQAFSVDYMKALNWIHYQVDETELRAELEQFLVARKAEALVPYVADLDGVTFSTLGKIAYCMNRGAQLHTDSVMRVRGALEKLRDAQTAKVVAERGELEEVEVTAAGRINEVYKNCYSRIDNVKARFLNGKIELKDIKSEVDKILEAQGARAQVLKRLVQHYGENLAEAQGDKALKTWVKPLQMIVKALGGDVKAAKPVKVAKPVKAAVKAPKAAKPTKGKAAAKPVKAAAKTRTVTIKPKREAGVPTVASQVRDLIRANKKSTDEAGMVQLVISKLGLTKERGRSVVKAFCNKVEA